MKNQYFGNQNDYLKYGILRILSNKGTNKIAVCWMLTMDNDLPSGRIAQRELRERDPILFDTLHQAVKMRNEYSVSVVEREVLIPNAIYYAEPMQNDGKAREKYFETFLKHATGADIVFLDPDRV